MTKYVASILCALVLSAGAASSRKPDVPADPVADDGPTFNLTSSRQPASRIHRSLQNEVNAATDRGLDWLVAQQKEDGSWSNEQFPALTGLAVWALAGSEHPQKKQAIARGVKYILSCARDDGGIYREDKDRKGGGLSNYNTAICMTALHATGDPALVPVVLKARKYIAGA